MSPGRRPRFTYSLPILEKYQRETIQLTAKGITAIDGGIHPNLDTNDVAYRFCNGQGLGGQSIQKILDRFMLATS